MPDAIVKVGRRPWCAGLAALAALALAGCGARIHEKHYFAAFATDSDGVRQPVQFYRLTVDGSTQFSNTRYLTGYFDERAVTLFFNEITAPPRQRLFDDKLVLPGAGEGTRLAPLSPAPDNAAFVLIMSTNADAVAGTIGSFAESQVVADALTGLLNRDRIKAKGQSDARVAVQRAEATALVTQVRAQMQAASAAGTGAAAAQAYLGALTVLARGLGYTGSEFATVDLARSWFVLEASRQGGGS